MADKMFQMRQVKIKSLQDQLYTTRYNRATFDLNPDDMSTDLSQSYLLLRLQLWDKNYENQYSTTQLIEWFSKNVAVSWGYEDLTYSPACLIKTALIRNKKTGNVVEAIQFANVLSQHLFQMLNDKETLSSTTLLSGSALEIGKGSGITQAMSSFLTNPTTVRIPLKDIFGCCNTANFWLSETGGLSIELEFEDRCDILKTETIAETTRIALQEVAPEVGPPVVLAVAGQYPDGVGLNQFFDQSPETMGANYTTNIFYDPDFTAGGLTSEIINAPRAGFKYDAAYFEPFAYDLSNNGLIQSLTFATAGTTAEQLNTLGFIVGDSIKINMALAGLSSDEIADIHGGKGVQQKVTEYVFNIVSVTATDVSNNPAFVTFAAGGAGLLYPPSWSEGYKELPPYLLSVEVMPSGTNLSASFTYEQIWDASFNLHDDSVILTAAQVIQLNSMGLTKLTDASGNDPLFPFSYESTYSALELGLMPIDPSGQLMVSDVVKYQNTDSSSLYSNGLVRLPIQGRALVIKSVTPIEGSSYADWRVTFSDLDILRGKGWRGDLIHHAGGEYEGFDEFVKPANYQLLIFNAMAAGVVPDISGNYPMPERVNPYNLLIPKVLSYKVDRLEIVLIQQTKTAPMSQGISVFKVEPQTIQYPQYQWSQQFQVTEPNTYCAMLLMPDYSNGRKLLSESRGVARWRNAINNTQMCNRDTIVYSNESDYPSSLYSDQLVDFWSNTPYNQRSLYGLREIAHARNPVISVPMKIYSAFQNGAMLGNGGLPFTLQVNLFGDSGMEKTISTGAVFLFKLSISSWGGMYLGSPI
jgi:hypothetical protein